VFAGASIITPVLLGIIVGAVASGAVGRAAASLPADDARGGAGPSFAAIFIAPWLAPFPLSVGVLALAMFALLAATYLAVAARDDALREDFRRRALGAAMTAAIVATIGLVVAHREAPGIGRGLTGGWAFFPVGAGSAALLAAYALVKRRWALARVAAAAEVSLVLWGWAAAQFPLLIPPAETIRASAAPRATLTLLLYALAGGGVILLPALAWLFRLFGRRVSA
jgi:cytochrome d ubiquinol oxidase subunit II